ncbi:hypothetical protein Nepgr_023689 [Nepenthes gracilis]|uniref:Protein DETOXIFICATION n=1 Tax=Nepenthes gracilis TaxID=150966 RepID=A0AAD3T4Q2_NEPGR|nr:hypothetical protein Nepgr_023689 [Nepenthes gracilis]
MESSNGNQEINQPLIEQPSQPSTEVRLKDVSTDDLKGRVWVETKKLWHIVGPAIFSRVASYSMTVVAQAFAGHLGDLELAAFSIANTVILGMASALETLCGQAFGAKRLHMLGVYVQRSWIVLSICSIILLPIYIWSGSILKLIGFPTDIAEETEVVSLWLIPQHFSFAFHFPLQRYLQSQLKTQVIVWVSLAAFAVHILLTLLLVYVIPLGIVGIVVALDVGWWVLVLGLFAYTAFGGCPETWSGFSLQAFSELWEFVKLSASSGVMLCLENWYYRILVLMIGTLSNAEIAVDALSICMTINGWEMMIPFGFFAATGVRVANELGAGNGKGAKFATKVSVMQSTIIGLFFFVLILIFHDKYALIFTSSSAVLKEADKLAVLLAFSILLNSIQPVLSGVAVGSGWQSWVAYINLFCYYIIGLPLGIVMGWVFHTGVMGIWAGMIFGGTFLQTVILCILTARSNWDKEAENAQKRVRKWTTPNPEDET